LRGRKRRHHGSEHGCARQEHDASAAAPDEADLRLIIMALLAEQPRTGVETIQVMGARVAGVHASSPAVVYPNLMMLEEMGLIASTTDPVGRKIYSLVNEGFVALAKDGRLLEAILAGMAGSEDGVGDRLPGMLRTAAPSAGRCHRWRRHGAAAAETV
jgi:DNA-binding PadR family transcriptional regulator